MAFSAFCCCPHSLCGSYRYTISASPFAFVCLFYFVACLFAVQRWHNRYHTHRRERRGPGSRSTTWRRTLETLSTVLHASVARSVRTNSTESGCMDTSMDRWMDGYAVIVCELVDNLFLSFFSCFSCFSFSFLFVWLAFVFVFVFVFVAGHIAVATAVFPDGTVGSQLDLLARAPLWSDGLDVRYVRVQWLLLMCRWLVECDDSGCCVVDIHCNLQIFSLLSR